MNILSKTILTATMAASGLCAFADTDYSSGIFFVNEDWYGHQNSTVNYLRPDDADGDYWQYRVIQAENPGMELGCTNQYGAIWNGRFYLIAKQEKDPGAAIKGGRITVAAASNLKILFQSDLIDPSGAQCDGRGFVGVDEHKGYISTSNGVWVFDLDSFTVTGQIEGSANPNVGDDRPNNDPTGSLYHGQSGTMVLAAGKVFATHQQAGLLVIDPAQDKVVNTISMTSVSEEAGIGSVVKSKDGMLWVSIAQGTTGTGNTLPYLLRVNPATLETSVIELPADIGAPNNSWYAWTPDAFCASATENILLWKGGKNSWFSGQKIYRYDIDRNEFSLYLDLAAENGNWNLYGCSMGIDPRNGEVYMSLFHNFQDPTYVVHRYTSAGSLVKEYPMISNYWFPSLPVFPCADPLAGVNAGTAPSGSIEVAAGQIIISGMAGENVAVFSTSGIMLVNTVADSDTSIITPSLPHGLYIVRAGTICKKIML